MDFNDFPELLDRFSPAALSSWGKVTAEEHARYHVHCFPEIEQIVSRVRERGAHLTPASDDAHSCRRTEKWATMMAPTAQAVPERGITE
jgi:hypothetical protein